MGELQAELNRLAGTTGLDAQGAANVYAGTSGFDLVGALNVAAGTAHLELQGVLNALAGTTGLGPNAAASAILAESYETIVGTHLSSSFSDADATSYETASITPTAGSLGLVAVASRTSGTAPIPTVTGCDLTWVQVATSSSAATRRLTVLRALGTPTTGALTISFGADSQLSGAWSIAEFAGVDTSGANGAGAVVQSVTNTGTATSGSVTLAAFERSANATYGAFGFQANETANAGNGFNKLGQGSAATPALTAMSEWRNDTDTSVDAAWTTSVIWHGIAIEIRAAEA